MGRNPTEMRREQRNDPNSYHRGNPYRSTRNQTPETSALVTYINEGHTDDESVVDDNIQYGSTVIIVPDRPST